MTGTYPRPEETRKSFTSLEKKQVPIENRGKGSRNKVCPGEKSFNWGRSRGESSVVMKDEVSLLSPVVGM